MPDPAPQLPRQPILDLWGKGLAGPTSSRSIGKFSPIEIARAWREEHPGKFDDLEDRHLIPAIKDLDPDTYALIDPLLLGSEVLSSGPRVPTPTPQNLPKNAIREGKEVGGTPALTDRPYPLPTVAPQLGGAGQVVGTGLAVAPAIGGAMLGTVINPGYGSYVGGAVGSGVGETMRQRFEMAMGVRDPGDWSPGVIATETALGAVNPTHLGTSIPRRIATQAGYGAGLAGASTVGRSLIEQGQWPSWEELAYAVPTGAVLGAGMQGTVEGAGAVGRAAHRAIGDMTDMSGGLPGGGHPGTPIVRAQGPPTAGGEYPIAGPPVPPPGPLPPAVAADLLPMAQAAAAQYQAEEDAIAQAMIQKFGQRALAGRTQDFHTALEVKDYLQEIAKRRLAATKAAANLLPDTGVRGATPMETNIFQGPANSESALMQQRLTEPPSDQRLLPPGRSAGPNTFVGFPPGTTPNIELLGQQPGRILAGPTTQEPTGPPPPPPPPPAAPPASGDGGEAFALSPPPGPRTVAPEPVQPSLLPPPGKRRRPLGQLPRPVLGPEGTREQPLLRSEGEAFPGQGISTPVVGDRTYASGPNAGPRREPASPTNPQGEQHGVPRTLKRKVFSPAAGKEVVEPYQSTRLASDPGTWEPDVRREAARMLQEMEDVRHTKMGGGLSPKTAQEYADAQGISISEAIAELRKSGASTNLSVPGAPVVHDIKNAAAPAFQNATAADVRRMIRQALLEGRGNALTDAVEEVARARMAAEAQGYGPGNTRARSAIKGDTVGDHIIFDKGAGDHIIGWTDEVTGEKAMPGQDVDPYVRSAREAEDGEIMAAVRMLRAGDPIDESAWPFFVAAIDEAERRGLIERQQMPLTMLAPGGEGGPSLFDFEGGPPEKPAGPRAEAATSLAPHGPERVAQLEQLSTDESMGVTFDQEGQSSLPGDRAAVNCTHCAERLIEQVEAMGGKGEVYGWEEGDNPTSIVAGPAQGARVDHGQGHDFAVIDDRYLVDPWAVHVEGSGPKAAYDLHDPADLALVRKYYGDPDGWVHQVEGKWVKGKPTPLEAGATPAPPAPLPQTALSELTGRRKARALANAAGQEELPPPPASTPERAAANKAYRDKLAREGKGGPDVPQTPALARLPHEHAGLPGLEAPPPPRPTVEETLSALDREGKLETGPDVTYEFGPPPKEPPPTIGRSVRLPDGRVGTVVAVKQGQATIQGTGWTETLPVEQLAGLARGPVRESQPLLPGAEGVRSQEIATPEVADLPFALSPPPSKPGKATAPKGPSLFDRFMGEEGAIRIGPRKRRYTPEELEAMTTPEALERDRQAFETTARQYGEDVQNAFKRTIYEIVESTEKQAEEFADSPTVRAHLRQEAAAIRLKFPDVFTGPPPPPIPARITAAPVKRPGLWARLKGEEGVLVFEVPAGDRTGIRRFLKAQEDEHGGTAWFSRAEQAIADGNWDKAWSVINAASAHSYTKAFNRASTPQEQAALDAQVRGTPLQQDLNAQIVGAGRSQKGQQTRPAPRVEGIPPSAKLTTRQQGQGMTVGPAGIINPGSPTERISARLKTRAKTVDREIMDSFVEAIGDTPELLHLVRGNRDAALRLGRQVADLILQGQVDFDPAAFPGMAREEVARHYLHSLSEAGKILGAHGRFVQEFSDELHEFADRMDMGAAKAGFLGRIGLRGRPTQISGAGGQRPLHPQAAKALDEIAQQQSIPAVSQVLLQNALGKRAARSTGDLLMDSQYSFLTSGVATALRNAYTTVGRYTVDLFDQALQGFVTGPLTGLTSQAERQSGRQARALLRERLTTHSPGGKVSPLRGLTATNFEQTYNLVGATLSSMSPKDARRSLMVLAQVPDAAANLIGFAGGEDLASAGSSSSILNWMLKPSTQRALTLWNRAQEYTGRGITFDTHFRAQIRAAGKDPLKVLANPSMENLARELGGQKRVEEMLHYASNAALEMTWAGQLANRSIPGALVKAVQDYWPAKLVQRFPRFNFSAAPRWIYDHSPAAMLDLIRLPFDAAGLTSTGKVTGGGRLYRGLQAQHFQTDVIPALRGKITEVEGRLGDTLLELQGTHREWAVRQRQVTRLEARAQQGLPDAATALSEATTLRDQLATRRARLKGQLTDHTKTVQDLKAQEGKLWKEVQNATGISAPNWSAWMARMTSGTFGLLGAAVLIRSQPGAEGTRFYQYRIERDPDEQGKPRDPYMLDLRSAAPFVQYLMVADVMVDLWRHTNVENMKKEAGDSINPLAWQRALWNNYEGKYTQQLLGTEFAQAFLSISRAAGTTLTIADLLTRNGWPSPAEAADALVGTVGQFLAGYVTPVGQFKDVAGQFSEEEATVRTTPRPTLTDPESWSYPLAEGLGRVPGLNRLLPPAISQTTGEPIRAVNPAQRALTGIGGSPADYIQEEARRIGLPGQSLYFRETGDRGVDQFIAETYSRLLNRALPKILESEAYQRRGTPANQRDFLQTYLPRIKRAALNAAKINLGIGRVEGATIRGEEARRKARRLRLIESLQDELPDAPGEDDNYLAPAPEPVEEATPAPPSPLPG